jgi:hypothetical protein
MGVSELLSLEGDRKAAICRSNVCGRYVAEFDACGILLNRELEGRIVYLLSHPETRCVADDPLF